MADDDLSPEVSRTIDYERHGHSYSQFRRTDPRIAARIVSALEEARTVVNVGAGTGSYEPGDRYVLAVEPSQAMRAQRRRIGLPRSLVARRPFHSTTILSTRPWRSSRCTTGVTP